MFSCLATSAYLFFVHNQLTWRNLGAPPASVVRIVDGDYKAVHVQTTLGDIYYCQFKSPRECWVKNDQPLEYACRTKLFEDALTYRPYREPPALSGVIAIKKYYSVVDEYLQVLTVCAITNKRKVYVWQDGYTTPYDGVIYFLTLPLAALCGLVFRVLFEARGMLIPKRKMLKSKAPITTEFSYNIFFKWMLLGISGWFIGAFLSMFPFYLSFYFGVTRALYNYSPSLVAFIVNFLWLPLGFSIGFMQARQLIQWGVKSQGWIWTATLGWWIISSYFRIDVFDFPVYALIILILLVTLFGVSQSYIIRNVFSEPGLWVLVNILGICALLFLQFHLWFNPPWTFIIRISPSCLFHLLVFSLQQFQLDCYWQNSSD